MCLVERHRFEPRPINYLLSVGLLKPTITLYCMSSRCYSVNISSPHRSIEYGDGKSKKKWLVTRLYEMESQTRQGASTISSLSRTKNAVWNANFLKGDLNYFGCSWMTNIPLWLKVLVKASQNLVKLFSLDFRGNVLGVFNVGAYSNTFPHQGAVMMVIQIAQLVIKYK